MGDVLLTTPLLRMLKNRFPTAEIDFLVKQVYESLIYNNRHVDQVFRFSPEFGFSEVRRIIGTIRKKKYDIVIDLQSNLRSVFFRFFSGAKKKVRCRLGRWRRFLLVYLRWDLYGKIRPVPLKYVDSVSSLGIKDDGLGMDLEIDEEAKHSISSSLKKRGIRENESLIVLAPGAGRATKRWPAERYTDVGNYFGQNGYRIVLVGGEKDREVCEEVSQGVDFPLWDFSGEFSLQETAALLARADLLITNDSGIMHMGSALGTRVVAIFGPTTHHFGFAPFRTPSVMVERSLNCRPCSYHGTDDCPKGHFRCMNEISSTDVIRATEELLNKGL